MILFLFGIHFDAFFSSLTCPLLVLQLRRPYKAFGILINKSHFKTDLLTFTELTDLDDGVAIGDGGGVVFKV